MAIPGTKVIINKQIIRMPIIGNILLLIFVTDIPVTPEATNKFAP